MARVPLQIGRQAGNHASASASIERVVNGYVEQAPQGKETAPVVGTPGAVLFATCGLGPIRAMLEDADTLYVVSGNEFYTVDSAATATLQGGGLPDGLVSMDVGTDADGISVVIEAGGQIWAFDGTTLTQNSDPDALPASGVAATDSLFIFGGLDTQQLFSSAINDPLDYDALDFASAEWKPDFIVTPMEQGGTLYAFGKRTLQAFYYDAGAGFPYSAYKDLKIDVGLAGKNAVTATNETLFWLAHEGSIRRLDGNTATPIQTPAIHRIIMGDPANGKAGWSDLSLTVASSHVWQGHLFIVFNNPDGCIAFDQTTQLWHERQSYGLDSWRMAQHADAFGYVLYGDTENGKVYRLASDAYDEAGEILPFEMVTPYAWAGNLRGNVDQLETVFETGMCDIALSPLVTMERTKDGRTFGSPVERSLGAQGDYETRVRWGRQGQGRCMAWRFRITDACKRACLTIFADVEIEK